MIALDTNLLVYAHREDSVWHDAAYTRVTELAEGRAPWAIPWPCIHEFLGHHSRFLLPAIESGQPLCILSFKIRAENGAGLSSEHLD
jgi:predicted nucleic acid-binding protein